MIRVLIIDDSAFIRKALSLMIDQDREMEVIGTASNGEEGYQLTLELQPDLVTLDIEMPGVGGLGYLKMIMKDRPTPILVVSSLTTKGALVTLQALSLGAVDYIPKSQSRVALDINKIGDELRAKIKAIAFRKINANTHPELQRQKPAPEGEAGSTPHFADLSKKQIDAVAIGVSTGGPPVLQTLLKALPGDFPVPILIAQHMPQAYSSTFAARLDANSELTVSLAENGETLTPGHVYLGRGGSQLAIRRRGEQVLIRTGVQQSEQLYHPSADILFESMARVYQDKALGLILTGMGQDGVQGLRKLRALGGLVMAQDEASCAVYGMPRAAKKAGLVSYDLNIDGLIRSLQSLTPKKGTKNG